jgi:hypothetical protein
MTHTTTTSNRVRGLAWTALSVAALGIGFAPAAKSDDMNKKIVVTTNAPIEIPGKALPAGTYVFKVLDSASGRNIVQIFDKDEKTLYGTVLGIPDYRLEPPDKPLIKFEERAANAPEAIKAIYYPGDNYGLQFVYPHNQATQIAKRTNQNVLQMRDNMSQNMKTQSTSASDSNVQSLEKTDVSGVDPSGAPVEIDVVILQKPRQ